MSERVFDAPYPVNLDLRHRRVLVVGGGAVAARKAAGLLRAGAIVTVVAPDAIDELAKDPDIRWHARPYQRGEVASYRLAITATSDPAVNAQVARDGESANVFVNSADDPANCSFMLPAVVTRGDLQIAVSTNGRSPAMARWARRRLERVFTDAHARTLDLLSELRDELRALHGTSESPAWDDLLGAEFDALVEIVDTGDVERAAALARTTLGLADCSQPPDTANTDTNLHRSVTS